MRENIKIKIRIVIVQCEMSQYLSISSSTLDRVESVQSASTQPRTRAASA